MIIFCYVLCYIDIMHKYKDYHKYAFMIKYEEENTILQAHVLFVRS